MKAKEFLLARLIEIRDGFKRNEMHGICVNVSDAMEVVSLSDKFADKVDDLLGALIWEWPEHSSKPGYPVKPPRDTAYTPFTAYGALRLWEGEYGDNRKRLLNFLISELSK